MKRFARTDSSGGFAMGSRSRTVRVLLVALCLTAITLVSGGPTDADSTVAARHVAKATVRLDLLTPARHAHEAVTFGITRSAGAQKGVRRVTINFGDGTAKAFNGRIPRTIRHRYRKARTYHASLRVSYARGRSIRSRAVVLVAKRNHVVMRSSTFQIPTTALTGVSPLSEHTEQVSLSGSPIAPRAGEVLLFAANPMAPKGLAVAVDSVTRSSGQFLVVGHDASLQEIYDRFSWAGTTSMPSRVTAMRINARGQVVQRQFSTSALPFQCAGSKSPQLNVTADFTKTHVDAQFDLANRVAGVWLYAYPVFSISAGFSGSLSCTLRDGFGINIPVPAVPGLVISVDPYVNISASGSITASASWEPKVIMAISRAPRTKPVNDLRLFSSVSASASGNATLSAEGGVSLSVSVAKAAGVEAKVGPHLDLSATLSGSSACVDATSSINAQVELFANFGFMSAEAILWSGSFFKSNLLHRCVGSSSGAAGSGSAMGSGSGASSPLGTAPGSGPAYQGPVTIETPGTAAQTWTDYVHAGGQQGPSLTASTPVGIACKTIGFKVADGNTWWYRIGSAPWNAAYYVSADAFYNNGATSGSLKGTPWVDPAVPDCGNSAGTVPTPAPTSATPTPTQGSTYTEVVGGPAHTWTNYTNAGGTEGATIAAYQAVQISCKVTGFKVADGNTWWYQIASSPWNSAYYVSADAFYNNGQTSGSLRGTPFVDPAVPDCGGAPPPPPATHAETTGGPTNTWTNYTNAGGTQGPTIPSNGTVQIACKLTGFKVADGNTWWYRIASSPWNGAYYASADAFYNNGQTSGSLQGTPWVDPAVPNC